MEIIGVIQKILPEQTGQSDKGTWSKQDFIIQTLDKYPRQVCLTNWKKKVSLADFAEGNLIKALINIESKEFKEKWYTDLKVWKMEKISMSKEIPLNLDFLNDKTESEQEDLPF